MSDRISFAVIVKLICTLFIAALASCDGGSGGGGGTGNILEPKKNFITISGSISDSLKSTVDAVDVGEIANNQLSSISLSSLELASGVVVGGDLTADDLVGTIKVLAVDSKNNIYSTKTDEKRKFALRVLADESYVIFFVSQNKKKQIGVLVHNATQDQATSYNIKSDINLGLIEITTKGKAAPSESKVRDKLKDIKESENVPKNIKEVEINPPDNLKAVVDEGVVELSWDAVSGVDGYRVYYDTTDDVSLENSSVTEDITSDLKASIAGLTAGKLYYFVVAAYIDIDDKQSKPSDFAYAVLRLESPTTINSPTSKASVIYLSWSEVTGAASYKVYYSTKEFNSISAKGVGMVNNLSNSTIAIISDLNPDTRYYLGVVAIAEKAANPDGNSHLSKIVTITTKSPPASKPTAPTNIQITGGDKAIDLNWADVAVATSYKVYYHTASFDSSTSGVKSKTGIAATNTSITGLANGTRYFIRLVASNIRGDSALSGEISAITELPAPTELKATGGDKIVDLSWNAVTGADSYKVYYSTKEIKSISDAVGMVNSQGNSTSIGELTNYITYYFRVAASNSLVDSKLSTQSNATPKLPAPQPSAAASIDSLAAVDLSWDALANITNYEIYYAKQTLKDVGYSNYNSVGGGFKGNISNISITIGDLSADTTYYFVVVANYDGKNGKKEESAAPEVSANSSYIAELAMGGDHGCVRLNTGGLKCWGKNGHGQLGVGLDDTTNRKTATSVLGILAKQISVSVGNSCAIDLEGRLYCWGNNGSSKLGLSGVSSRSIPTLVEQDDLNNVSLVSAGLSSTCALAGGNNFCWGSQKHGGLGNGETSGETQIAQEIDKRKITSSVKQFAVGSNSVCAIDASDDLWCWGHNNHGQVGNGDGTTDQLSPVKPKLQGSSTATTMLDGHNYHYCVVDDANKIQCWGYNDRGQLGIDSTADSNSPQYVLASRSVHLEGVSKIATGFRHSCAIIKGGSVHCWGDSDDGKIGSPWQDESERWGPDRLVADTDMPGIDDAIDIAAGFNFTCVLLADKVRVKCWGINSNGQLGNGSFSSSPVPVAVKMLK